MLLKTIWKSVLEVYDYNSVKLPKGSIFLAVGVLKGQICIWYRCDPEQELVDICYRIVGTGQGLPVALQEDELTDYKHVGSVVVDPFVWHVFLQEVDWS